MHCRTWHCFPWVCSVCFPRSSFGHTSQLWALLFSWTGYTAQHSDSDKRTDVVTVLDAAVGGIAVVHATTLADLLVILFLGSLHDKLNVYDLRLADFSVLNAIQWATAAFAVGRLMLYDSVWRTDRLQGASLVSWLSTTWLVTRLTQWLRLCLYTVLPFRCKDRHLLWNDQIWFYIH